MRNVPKHDHGWSMAQRIQANRRSLQLTALIIVLFLISMLFSVITRNEAEQAASNGIAAACDFWQPLTSLPVTINPPAHQPTRVGVQILAGAREGYAGQCHPPRWAPMPPAHPSLIRWARYYHIPVIP